MTLRKILNKTQKSMHNIKNQIKHAFFSTIQFKYRTKTFKKSHILNDAKKPQNFFEYLLEFLNLTLDKKCIKFLINCNEEEDFC